MWETEVRVPGEAGLTHRERKVIVEQRVTEGISVSLSELDSSPKYVTPQYSGFHVNSGLIHQLYLLAVSHKPFLRR